MGFGVIAGVVAFANILKLSGGPAVVGIDDGGSQFFVLSSGQLANFLKEGYVVKWFMYTAQYVLYLGFLK